MGGKRRDCMIAPAYRFMIMALATLATLYSSMMIMALATLATLYSSMNDILRSMSTFNTSPGRTPLCQIIMKRDSRFPHLALHQI